MIIETTQYFSKTGLVHEVLEMRRQGCRLRQSLGLPPGEVFLRVEGDGPDVRWQCTFADETEFHADMAARQNSEEFRNQRNAMGALLDRFERHVDRPDAP